MKTPALLRLVTGMMCLTIALTAAIPAQARSDWQTDQNAPQWLDQTVYRPPCIPADCACDCRSERLCTLRCVQW
jgi:hypothetical protein